VVATCNLALIENEEEQLHFSAEELAKICIRCETLSTKEVQREARRLFPGRQEYVYEGLYVLPGPCRCFKNAEGEYEQPLCVAVSRPVAVGVMRDGRAASF